MKKLLLSALLLAAGLSLSACNNGAPDVTSSSPATTTGFQQTHQTTTTVTGPIANAITDGPDGAVWYTLPEENKIGRISTETGGITEYDIPTDMASPSGITTGPDGKLWFTETSGNKIGKISPYTGKITEYNVPTIDAGPVGITAGPDGNLWFTEAFVDKIGRISPASGTVTEYDIPTANAMLYDGITAGPDGFIWFTGSNENVIGKINPETGEITEYTVPAANGVNAAPYGIAAGPDGYIWFTERNDNAVSKISTDTGEITTFPLPGDHVGPYDLTTGPDGNLWFTKSGENTIGCITSDMDTLTFYDVPTANAGPHAITTGPDGDLWFTEAYKNNIGKIDAQTWEITEYSLTGNPATAETTGGELKLNVASPEPDKTFFTNLLKVTGSVSDAGAGVWLNGNKAAVAADGSFEGYAVLENIGKNDIEITAATSENEETRSITVTFEPPLVVRLTADPESGTDYTKVPLTVYGRVNKPAATVTVRGEKVPVQSDGSFETSLLLEEGSVNISAVASLGQEQDEHYIAYFIENGVLGYVPGYSIFFSSRFSMDSEVAINAGETFRLPVTLDMRKDGPGDFSATVYCIGEEYGDTPLPWPEGIQAYLETRSLTVYPNTVYEFDLVITASPECPPDTYYAKIEYDITGVSSGGAGIRVQVTRP